VTESLYQEIILDHYKNPHHKGLREPSSGPGVVEVHHVNPTCGDEVTVRVQVLDGVVQDVKCALLGWMAWKDATAQAVGKEQS
jgi:nitrogen fixation NifU-like protein